MKRLSIALLRSLPMLIMLVAIPFIHASKSKPKHETPAGFSVPARCMQKIALGKCVIKDAQTMVCNQTVVTFQCVDAKPDPQTGPVPKDRIELEGEKGEQK
jgi:hypothetical protein